MTSAYHASCERPHNRAQSTCTRPQWTLAASIAASSLAFLDGSIVNVALPALGKSLEGSSMDLQWTINGYLLPLAALLLLGGAAGDNFGRRRLLLAGIATFAAASIGCALAPTFAALVAMRALQGVGGAMLMPNSLALLGGAFPERQRGRAIGTWAAAGVFASAVGPPLGGWLIDLAGWRAIFWLNVPIALVAAAITWRHVDEAADTGRALDWPGAAIATAGLFLVTLAISFASSQRTMTATDMILGAAGLAVLAGFVAWERWRVERAMMPLSMFGAPAFVGLMIITFLSYGALGGLFILLPYVLIEGGYTPLQAGLGLLPFSIIAGLASRPMGQLAGRVGPRWPLVIGSGLGALGYALLVLLEPSGSYWATVVPGAVTVAVGTAGVVAPMTAAVLDSVDERHTGTASGLSSAVARTGGLIATVVAGAVLGRKGAALVIAFHGAAIVGAVLALAAGIVAWLTVGGTPSTRSGDR